MHLKFKQKSLLYCPLKFFHPYYMNMNCLSESHRGWLMDIVCFFSGELSIRLIWRRFVQSNRLWLNATLPTKVSSLLFLFCEEYKAKEGPFWLGLTSTFSSLLLSEIFFISLGPQVYLSDISPQSLF
jgi:hypothetical protein